MLKSARTQIGRTIEVLQEMVQMRGRQSIDEKMSHSLTEPACLGRLEQMMIKSD